MSAPLLDRRASELHGVDPAEAFDAEKFPAGDSDPVAAVKPIARSAVETESDQPILVLIADDEAPIAETVSVVVEEAGYTPLVAVHGKQALELARAHRPALLITDLMMPHMNGIDLIATLREDARIQGTQAPPSILMTAAGLQKERLANADAVLAKPFSLDDLEALLHRFLAADRPV